MRNKKILLIGGALVLGTAVTLPTMLKKTENSIIGKEKFQNDISTSIMAFSETDETVTIEFEDVNMAKAVYQYLGSENCTEYTENSVTLYKEVLEATTSLSLSKKKIEDISGIENFTNLQTLKLAGNSISDITPIGNLSNLLELDLSENKLIEDISCLSKNSLLQKLNLRDNTISDLTAVSSLTNLQYIDISQNHITVLTPLSGLGNIETLVANNNYINSIEEILELGKLKELNLNHNSITDITGISSLMSLKTLNIGYNSGLTNLTPLVQKAKLRYLEDTEEKTVYAVYDSTTRTWIGLEGYDETVTYTEKETFKLLNLANLNIESNGLSNFSTIMVLEHLKKLEAQDNDITSISGIDKMTSLETLNLNNNNLVDITPLFATATDTATKNEYMKLQNLISVSMANNYDSVNNKYGIEKIYKDVTKTTNGVTTTIRYGFHDFPNLKTLILNGNKIYDIETIAYMDFTAIDLSDQTIFISANYREIDDEIQTIMLPNIFTYTLENNSNVYSEEEFEYRTEFRNTSTNVFSNNEVDEEVCSKTSEDEKITDRELVFVDTNDLYTNSVNKDEKVATVEIVGGNADGSKVIYNSVKSNGLESIIFKDANLWEDVVTEMKTKNKDHDVLDIGYMSQYKLINIFETNLNKVKNLDASNNQIQYVDGIKRLKQLQGLDLGENEISEVGEIALLANLTSLSINNNIIPRLNDFAITKRYGVQETLNDFAFESKITYFDASGNRNQNLGCEGISEFTPLSECTKLTELYLHNNNISEITTLAPLTKLTTLNLGVNNISDITTVKNFTLLTKLILANNNINDEQLENLIVLTALKELDLSENNLKDIDKLNEITSLTSLSLAKNDIEDITLISSLRKLSSLNLSGNNISELTGIGSLTALSSLELSNNKISDITLLAKLINLSTLKLNFNRITDIEVLEELKEGNLETLELESQTITIELTEEQAKEEFEIDLPSIFQKALIDDNIVYSERGLATDRCEINDNIVTVSNLFSDIATVRIRDGIAMDSKLVIGEALRGEIEYSTQELTNKDVEATITFNRVPVTITNNDGYDTYTFTENGEFTFEFQDDYGFIGTATAVVDWIDKDAAELTVSYEKTEKEDENGEMIPITIVTITSNEEIQEVEGWTLSEDRKTLTKSYTENTKETITVYDLVGNDSSIEINAILPSIDKEAPELEVNYSTTELTKGDVIVTITSNEEIQEVEGWTLSSDKKTLTKTYTSNKTETIIICDLAGNETEQEISVTNIDKTAPVLSIDYSTTETTEGPVTVTITADEKVQTVTGWTLSNDQMTLKKVYTVNKVENVTVYDLIGNKRTVTVSVQNIEKQEEELEISSDKYEISDIDNPEYISNVAQKTSVKDFINNIDTNATSIVVKDKNGNTVSNTATSYIATGMTIEFDGQVKYTVVVEGDINGDGKISASDLSILKMKIVGKRTLEGAQLEAADITRDNNVKASDLSRMKRTIVGLD